jgi:hypothetical protein
MKRRKEKRVKQKEAMRWQRWMTPGQYTASGKECLVRT